MDLSIPEALTLAISHHSAGRLDQAEEIYRIVLKAEPDNSDALDMLGALLSQRGRHNEGLDLIERALRLKPDAPDYHANRGLVLFNLGYDDLAIEAYNKAIALRPNSPTALYNLGNALQRRNDFEGAMACYRKAIEIRPTDAVAHSNMGNTLLKQEKYEEAEAAFRQAIRCAPEYAEAMSNLGAVLSRQKRLDEGIEWYAKAAALRPRSPEIINNYAGGLKDAGRLDEAISIYRRAIAANAPASVHSNLCYLLYFHPEYDNRAIAADLKRWDDLHGKPLAKENQGHQNHSVADRRLKIGYVSPMFFHQAEAHFVLPLLACHDHEKFEIHCFSSVRKPDETTDLHRRFADVWHDVAKDDDKRLAERVGEAHIDILVDLAMHLGENRLLTFARKPAPVQVTWLAYPGSTGLTAIDYRFTDAIIDPPSGDDSLYAEETIRLPGCWCAYDPLSQAEQRPLPQDGPITFGSLNNPCKFNPRTLRIWVQVMRNVANSRLLLLCISENHRMQIRRLFEEAGIKRDRIDFFGTTRRPQYLRQYDRIDIALDPLPYNGITTTCDAIWMGVPVVTLKGATPPSRAGASVLTAAGLPELIADTPEKFIQIASDLGNQLARLTRYRATLRQQFLASPLADGPRITRGVEEAYRRMWEKGCAGVRSTR